MKKRGLFANVGKIMAGMLLFVLAPWPAANLTAQDAADTKTVVSSGYSRIYGSVGDAKGAALAESIRFAVQKAAENLLSEEQLTEDFERISRVLQENPNQFIQDYRILREIQVDRSYRVLVRATIMTNQIQQALSAAGLQTRPKELPTVLLMVAEKHLGDTDYRFWWKSPPSRQRPDTASSPMARALMDEGFTVIDPVGSMEYILVSLQGLSLTATPADYEAAIFARRMGAQLVLLGTAEVTPGENRLGENTETYRGNISLRVIDTQTGRSLTTISQQGVSISKDRYTASSNAMADAAYQAGMQLASRIDSLWMGTEMPAGGITISISGKNILPNLEQFRKTISDIRGIASVRTMQFSVDNATLWVDYRGTPDELVSSLLKQSYGPFGIHITDVAPDNLKIEMRRGLTSEILTE